MTEKPIIFSTAMVAAILAGRKTQTRRIISQNNSGCGSLLQEETWSDFNFDDVVVDGQPKGQYLKVAHKTFSTRHRVFPKLSTGDLLWVRETYTILEPEHCEGSMETRFYYKSGQEYNEDWRLECIEKGYTHYRWKPAIHMRKDAARIWLQITDVHAERLQDISEEDAIAEGVGSGFQMNAGWPDYQHIKNGVCALTQDTSIASFASLWDSINAKPGNLKQVTWNHNPWVWVIEFKVLSTTGKPEVRKEVAHAN